MKKFISLLLCFLCALAISVVCSVNALAASTDPVDVPDTHLKSAILEKLGKTPDYTLTKDDMASFEILEVSNNNIVSLEGLQYCTDLRKLDLSHNQVNSMDQLKELKDLMYVNLSDNKISTVPDLSKLKNLYCLYLDHNTLNSINGIHDLP